MIGISESLIRHTRRISTDQHHAAAPVDRRMAAMQLQQRDRDQDLSDPNTKLQLIDTMLSSSPPLPAPPLMQQAQIQAQERELMMQMQMHHHAQAAAAANSNAAHASAVVAPRAHRPSISAGIKPLVIKGAPLPPPPATAAAPASSALAAQLKPRLAQQAAAHAPPPISSAAATAAAAAAAASNDLFAKVEVPSRGKGGPGAGDAASFQPSSLAAALCDSGMLFGRERHAPVRREGQHHRGGSNNHDNSSRAGGQNGSKESDGCTLTIYLHPYSDTAVRPCRVLLQLPPDTPSSNSSSVASHSNPTTDELLASLLAKWTSGELARNFGLRAALAPEAADKSSWALHMVDEDTVDSEDECDDEEGTGDVAGAAERAMAAGEERGMPEEDLPPLERGRPVKSMGATTLAMVVAAGSQHRMPKHAATTPLSPSAAAAAAATTTASTAASASAATAASSSASSSSTAAAASSGLTSPSRPSGPTSPSAASASPSGAPNTHATQPLPPQLRRYDSARAAAPSFAGSSLSPSAQPKYRTVSVFSGSGAGAGVGVGAGAGMGPSSRSSSQQAMSSDPSRHSVMLGHGGMPGLAGGAGGVGVLGEKFYLKIHIGDHESHIIGLYKAQLLSEVLPVLSKKKQAVVAMKSELYRFLYLDPLLRGRNDDLRDMGRVRIGELASDELILVPRLGGGGGGVGAGAVGATGGGAMQEREMRSQTFSSTMSHHHHSHHHGLGGGHGGGAGAAAGDDSALGLGTSVAGGGGLGGLGSTLMSPNSDAPSLSSFQFSLDTASAYCEYRVIKTNQRGKRQPRIFGMDRHRIYNKTQQGGDESDAGASGMFSFIQRRIGTEPGVSRATRDINTIASVHVVSLRPTCFCIAFKESAAKDSKVAQTREYELETKMECAEIVAKLRFLMSHAVLPPSSDAAVAASLGGSSMLLGQSTK